MAKMWNVDKLAWGNLIAQINVRKPTPTQLEQTKV